MRHLGRSIGAGDKLQDTDGNLYVIDNWSVGTGQIWAKHEGELVVINDLDLHWQDKGMFIRSSCNRLQAPIWEEHILEARDYCLYCRKYNRAFCENRDCPRGHYSKVITYNVVSDDGKIIGTFEAEGLIDVSHPYHSLQAGADTDKTFTFHVQDREFTGVKIKTSEP